MAYTFGNNGLIICHNTIRYYGNKIPNPPNFKENKHNVTQINGKLYINGWEYNFHSRKWKRTLRAIWHKFF
jgi:hypothetical protein